MQQEKDSKQQGQKISVGVQHLIDQLRDQGVQKGQKQAQEILDNAKIQAAQLIDEAKKAAEDIMQQAKKEANFIKQAGYESLVLAKKNMVLELKDFLIKQFAQQITETVSDVMNDEELLKSMILAVAGENYLGKFDNMHLILPKKIIESSSEESLLLDFVNHQANKLLDASVTYEVDDVEGIMFCIKEKKVEVHLSDKAVSKSLLTHLQPRFLALLEGIEK